MLNKICVFVLLAKTKQFFCAFCKLYRIILCHPHVIFNSYPKLFWNIHSWLNGETHIFFYDVFAFWADIWCFVNFYSNAMPKAVRIIELFSGKLVYVF